LARALQSHGLRSKVYGPVLLAIFRRKYRAGDTRVVFTLEEVREELLLQGVQARNVPDLIYRMKSRTVLPAEIQEAGFRILEITSRGVYALALGEATLIGYPEVGEVVELEDRTPLPVRRLLTGSFGAIDEQGLLSVLRYNDLISHFLEVPTFHFKAHVRKSVPGVGQAEIDDVHIAVDPRDPNHGPLTIVPLEAKAKDDPVNRVQIVMQTRYALHAFPGLAIRPLTVKLFEDGLILMMEFNVTEEPNLLQVTRHRHYRLLQPQLTDVRGVGARE
jgi:hypothetical protein